MWLAMLLLALAPAQALAAAAPEIYSIIEGRDTRTGQPVLVLMGKKLTKIKGYDILPVDSLELYDEPETLLRGKSMVVIGLQDDLPQGAYTLRLFYGKGDQLDLDVNLATRQALPGSINIESLQNDLRDDLDDAKTLEGNNGAFYRDASNLNAGTISPDRYSAIADLLAENKVGDGAGQLARGDHDHDDRYTKSTDLSTPGTDDPRTVNVSADGSRFLCTDGGNVTLWSERGEQLARFGRGYQSSPRAKFDGDGQRFLLWRGGRPVDAEVRDRDGHILARLFDPDGQVVDAAFASDDTRVLTTTGRGLVRRWILDTDDLAALAASRSTREMSLGERERFDLLDEEHSIEIVARSRVDALRREFWVPGDVVAALETDPDLDPRVREAALEVARALGPDYNRLNERAWVAVRTPEAKPEEVAKALRAIEWICEKIPGNGALPNTLGAAQLRSGLHEEALTTLKESNRLNRERRDGGEPSDSAFLAIAHHQLGNVAESVESLKELERQMEDERNRQHWENRALLDEVRELLGPKSD
jgi:hypothetical protein